jgi:imidazolonepropionase-like amidohydrolase
MADIIVVDGDPLTSIREIRRVAHVVKGGALVR